MKHVWAIRVCAALCLALLLAGPRTAALPARGAACASNCSLYLPLIELPLAPDLLSPADGTHSTSLAPLLYWSPHTAGIYDVQVAFDTNFSTLAFTSTVAVAQPFQSQVFVMEGNLIQATLFWRVGLQRPGGDVFSPTWAFTTPARNAALLPRAPHLLTPTNQAVLPARSTTLSWESLASVQYYRVGVYRPDGSQFSSAIVAAPNSALALTNLAAGTAYTWKVKALNAYGWSIYSTIWSFQTP